MTLAGSAFICLLVVAFIWTYTKSPLLGIGGAAIFWSVVHFFTQHNAEAVQERHEQKYGREIEAKPNDNIFVHHDD